MMDSRRFKSRSRPSPKWDAMTHAHAGRERNTKSVTDSGWPSSHPSMNYRIRDWPEYERPRERLNSAGASALSTRELLAILIGSGTESRSAVDVAGDLLQFSNGSLRQLATTSP